MVSESESRFYWYVLSTGNSERENEKKSKPGSAEAGSTQMSREGTASGCEELLSILLLSLQEGFVEAV